MYENEEEESAPTKQATEAKHLALHKAISDIDSISRSLDALIDQIQGPVPTEDGPGAHESQPYLYDVLNNGADAIHQKIYEANDRIQRITSLLF